MTLHIRIILLDVFFDRGSDKFFLNSKQVAAVTFWGPLKKIQHNGTKIGANNIFGVISLDFEFQLNSSSNNSNMDKSFGSNFCHQEGNGATFKYSAMFN